MGAGALVLVAGCTTLIERTSQVDELYGLIGELKAVPGKRGELVALFAQDGEPMPGNLVYLVAEDAGNADSIWITEVWRSKADHEGSLGLPAVQRLITRARPLIAGFGTRVETRPLMTRQ